MVDKTVCVELGHQLLPQVKALAEEAGRLILDIYQGDYSIEEKADATPVTEADYAAHHCIVDGLSALTPHIPVLSEESDHIPFAVRQQWQCYWLVDPLDGTREFVKGNGEFSVNIALIHGHQPILGVIYVPVTGINYFASLGQGAYKQTPDGEREDISCRPYDPDKLVIAASRSFPSQRLQDFLQQLGSYEIVISGSSIKSCLVAEGSADLYARLGPTSEWDTAAAQCIVEEAGGRITDISMQTLRYNTKDSLLNPEFFVFGDKEMDWARFLPDTE